MKNESMSTIKSASFLAVLFAASFFQVAFAQAPVVSSSIPSINGQNVPANSAVSLTFSQVMSAASASANALKIHTAGGLMAGGSFSGGGTNTITCTPSAAFRAGEVITVSATTAMQNTSSVAMIYPRVSNFTVQSAFASGAYPLAVDINKQQGGSGSINITTGDFNGDGRVDIARAYGLTSTTALTLFMNNGDNNFPIMKTLTTPAYTIRDAEAFDCDNDGDVDLIASYAWNTFTIYKNNGSGNFTSTTTAAPVSSCYLS